MSELDVLNEELHSIEASDFNDTIALSKLEELVGKELLANIKSNMSFRFRIDEMTEDIRMVAEERAEVHAAHRTGAGMDPDPAVTAESQLAEAWAQVNERTAQTGCGCS